MLLKFGPWLTIHLPSPEVHTVSGLLYCLSEVFCEKTRFPPHPYPRTQSLRSWKCSQMSIIFFLEQIDLLKWYQNLRNWLPRTLFPELKLFFPLRAFVHTFKTYRVPMILIFLNSEILKNHTPSFMVNRPKFKSELLN